MAETTLLPDNKIELPEEARQALGIKPGDKILVVVKGSKVIVLERPDSYSNAIQGMFQEHPYPEDYLKQERSNWE